MTKKPLGNRLTRSFGDETERIISGIATHAKEKCKQG